MTTEDAKLPIEEGAVPVMPKGRAAMLAAFKGANGDREDDPEDDELWDFGHKAFGERDELKGKYDTLNGANDKLAAAISEDPRFAKLIAMIGSGEKPLYALGRIFGNVIDQLDEEATEGLKKGQEEYSSSFNQLKQNFEAYKANLKKFGEDNGYDDATMQKINDVILDLSDAFMNWDITTEIIDVVYKGLDYDTDRAALSEAEALSVKNNTIDEIKSGGKKPLPIVPDIKSANQQPANRQAPKFSNDEEFKPYSSRLEKVR